MAKWKNQSAATFESADASWNRLKTLLKDHDIALFLGAGLTVPNQTPSWKQLASRLLNQDDATVRSLEAKNIALTTQLQLAKQIVSQTDEWIEAVRRALYEDFFSQVEGERFRIPGLDISDFGNQDRQSRARVRRFFELTNPVLFRLVQACSVTASGSLRHNERIGAILTTNLDGLLQACDRACHGSPRMLRTVERATKSSEFWENKSVPSPRISSAAAFIEA